MGNSDDASMISSFEDVGESPVHMHNYTANKTDSNPSTEPADFMSGISGNLGKAVAGQVCIKLNFCLLLLFVYPPFSKKCKS